MHGAVPYRDFPMEYPPFSLFFFILPRLFASTYIPYVVAFEIEVVIFSLVGLYIIYDISSRLGKEPWKLMTVYTLAILAIGPITGQQYDIFPSILGIKREIVGVAFHRTILISLNLLRIE